jgi:hypothetical protein
MLQQFFFHTLHLPRPVAAWLTDFCDTLYAIASSPAGIMFSIAFLLIGYFRLGMSYVAIFAVFAVFGLVQMRWQGWAIYTDEWRREQLIVFVLASLALCFASNFIGRRLRPEYI